MMGRSDSVRDMPFVRRARVAISREPDELVWLRAVVEGTASSVGNDFLCNLVRHLSLALDRNHAFIAEFTSGWRVRTLAYWNHDRIVPNTEFDVRQSSGEDVVGVQAGESYLGTSLRSHEGATLGYLCAFDERSMPADPRKTAIFEIFAARAAAELDRLRIGSKLRESEDRLRDLVEGAPIEAIRSVHKFEEIVGESPVLQQVIAHVKSVAPTDASVLIWGETGTGKELIARAVHANSTRAEKPFIKVNCAALPAGLVESELFGHERGAFSGAIQRRIGRFELAHGGTIFLDEIGEVPKDVQVKLLRVLQEREFERVGGSQTISCDVRVIAATNRKLEQAIQDGDFRADLYYRLNVFPIKIPALRERPDDIPLLVHFFVQKYAARLGRRIESVDAQTLQRLLAYPWPGNIRELENIIERALILSTTSVLRIEPDAVGASGHSESCAKDDEKMADYRDLDSVQRLHILNTLRDTNWVIEGFRGAAMRLSVKPATLRHRMKKLGIARNSHQHS